MAQAFIPVADPSRQYHDHADLFEQAAAGVLRGGRYILGQETLNFERAFADYLGVAHCVGVNSGTDAIVLALRALGIGEGDEVITVSLTAVATVAAIELTGATPVLVDLDPKSRCMDPDLLEPLINEKTRAILPVHLYGQPADMPAIMRVAQAHNLKVIEDCAQAHGATIDGKMVGSFGHLACFSFYPTKNLGAFGDGGAVVTEDENLAHRLRLIREYGWEERYVSKITGMNTRLDELQAAFLNIKLGFLTAENQKRCEIARFYTENLSSAALTCPQQTPGTRSVYHLYVVESEHRELLRSFLAENGVGTAIHYPLAVHQQPAYLGRLKGCDKLPVTERLVGQILSLPMFPQLTSEETARVCQLVRQFLHLH